MRALIIDDSRAMRAIMRRALNELGIVDCVEAGNGQEALLALAAASAPIGLAMVDWHMPVMDGLDFVKTVRATTPSAQLKIVMCTTETEIGHMVQALEAGADEYVMKPFTKEAIQSKLQILGLVDG